jgi:hypothetical protein
LAAKHVPDGLALPQKPRVAEPAMPRVSTPEGGFSRLYRHGARRPTRPGVVPPFLLPM